MRLIGSPFATSSTKLHAGTTSSVSRAPIDFFPQFGDRLFQIQWEYSAPYKAILDENSVFNTVTRIFRNQIVSILTHPHRQLIHGSIAINN